MPWVNPFAERRRRAREDPLLIRHERFDGTLKNKNQNWHWKSSNIERIVVDEHQIDSIVISDQMLMIMIEPNEFKAL